MKKTAMILLCTFLFGGLLSGCSNNNTDPQTETTAQSEETAGSPTGSGTFDWDTAMSQATFNGKAIPMPFSVNDLGEGYHMGAMDDDPVANDYCMGGLYDSDGALMAVLEFYHVLTKDYTDDYPVGNVGELRGLCIQGIQEGTPMEQVYATWGEPDEKTSDTCCYNCPDKGIIVNYEGDHVSSFIIDFEFQKPQTETTTQTEQTDTLAPTEEETADSTESSTNSETSTAGTGTFDWDTAMSQATLDGKAIPMPFTMNDLGDEYHLGLMENNPFTDDGCTAELYNSNDEDIAFLEFYHILLDDYTDDCLVGCICHLHGLSIGGIQKGTPMEEVYDKWGQPQEISRSKEIAYYYNDSKERVIVDIDDSGCVSSISVYFEFEE